MMTKGGLVESALKNRQLLTQVVDFKKKFYPRAWARYDLAVQGSLELLPPEYSQKFLQEDYFAMRDMIYGEYPKWRDIMGALSDLQTKLNAT